MNQGFFTGISGIQSHQIAIDVTSDNIANVNNMGFRGSNAEFGNLLEKALVTASGNSPIDNTVGVGSRIQATTMNTLQGSLLSTDSVTDLSIGGDGWFGLEGLGGVSYTRNGQFTYDMNRNLVNTEGYYVLGTLANNIETGTISQKDPLNYKDEKYVTNILTPISLNTPLADVSAQTKINLPHEVYLPPQPTTYARFFGNIGFDGTTTTYPEYVTDKNYKKGNGISVNAEDYNTIDESTKFDETAVNRGNTRLVAVKNSINEPPIFVNGVLQNEDLWSVVKTEEDASVRTISATVISGENEKNKLSLTFTKSLEQPNEGVSWEVVAKIYRIDTEIIYDENGNRIDVQNVETVYSTQNGTLQFNEAGALIENTLEPMDNNGSMVDINLGGGYDGIISTGPETSLASEEDGIVAGWLEGYTFNHDGNIVASFDNGFTTSVGKVALFHFQNEQGLERAGSNRFLPTSDSGNAIFWQDSKGVDFLGAHLYSGKLENSNVRLDVALTDLIILQKAYNANAKSITTGDEIIKTALGMKR
jgi:flagellar hook protein FlgE